MNDADNLVRLRAQLRFLRENFRNDGAEGETVHVVCDATDELLRLRDDYLAWRDSQGGTPGKSRELVLAEQEVERLKKELECANDLLGLLRTEHLGKWQAKARKLEDEVERLTAQLEAEKVAHVATGAEVERLTRERDEATNRLRELLDEARAEVARLTRELQKAHGLAKALQDMEPLHSWSGDECDALAEMIDALEQALEKAWQ